MFDRIRRRSGDTSPGDGAPGAARSESGAAEDVSVHEDASQRLDELRRPAAVATVGGFRPPDGYLGSWIGTVKACAADEVWPTADGQPMHGVLQLDVADLPIAASPHLAGIALLTLFIAEDLPLDAPNGDGWLLRTYANRHDLVPLERPTWAPDPKLPKDYDPALNPFPLTFEAITDWPSRDDVPMALLDDWDERTEAAEGYECAMGLKVGGWPYCVQAEVAWAENGDRLPGVEFVLQVDSDEKVGFVVADSGVVYIGRGGDGSWHLDWQCY